MATTRNVAVFVGSLRKASINRKVALALMALAPPTLKLSLVEIGEVPLYNEEWEANPPQSVIDLKAAIQAADAVLFITPEYNRSVPGVLKNAIDVASRPYGKSAWNGKPGAVVSASPGAMGGFGANQHLRQSCVFLNVPLLPHEAYLGNANALFDDAGQLNSESTKEFLAKFLERFVTWIESNIAS